VISCYEPGRDGFWLDRALCANGIENLVVNSASIEVPRRARRRKTAHSAVAALGRWRAEGVERRASAEPRGGGRAAIVARDRAAQGRTETAPHTQSVAARHAGPPGRADRRAGRGRAGGRSPDLRRSAPGALDAVRSGARGRAARGTQSGARRARRKVERTGGGEGPPSRRARRDRGGELFVFVTELFGWRTFVNPRELAGAVGLTGTPWRTGDTVRDQGLSKAGNLRMRSMLVEIAWCWLRYRPDSALVAASLRQRRRAHTQGGDRGAGAQAPRCALALPRGRHDAADARAQ
jgi:transposase